MMTADLHISIAKSWQVRGLPWLLRWYKICLQCRRLGFDPGVSKIPWRREWQPSPVFLPGKLHGQRSLAGYSPWGRKESDTTERLTLFMSSQSFLFFVFLNLPKLSRSPGMNTLASFQGFVIFWAIEPYDQARTHLCLTCSPYLVKISLRL